MTDYDETSARRDQLSPAKRALLAKLKARNTAVSLDPAPQIPVRPADKPATLSFAQQRLWFLDQLQRPELPIYNITGAWRLRGPLSRPVLQHSLNEIMRRHEGLRTTFVNENGGARQVIAADQSLPLAATDLSHLSSAEREKALQHTAVAIAQEPFELTTGPLIRAHLLHLAAADHLLLVNMHHIVSDGWSLSLFVRELTAHYRAFVEQRPSPLPPLSIQYPDFAHWQRHWLQGDVLDKQLSYWREQLSGRLPILTLPTDHPRPAEPTFRGRQRRFHLSADLSAAFRDLSQAENSTLFMTLLAAFNVLLQRHSGQDDILVGSPIANRNHVEIEPLIGFFVNTLVLRTDLGGEPTFRQLLQRVRQTTIGALAHQDVPFEKLVEVLQPARSLSHNPLFQVVFALQNTPITADDMPDVTSEWVPIDSGIAKFDLTLRMTDNPDGLTGVLEYSTDLFTAETIERLLAQWQTLLAGIVANPDTAVSRLPLLPADQRRQVLHDWNQAAAYPVPGPIHKQFEAQVERRPQATAVACDDQTLTYASLNARANQLAHHLRDLGVGPESRVGLFVDRSLDMVVALLGILKAGGAYVPMDPAYPAERLAFMLADAGIEVLLTESALTDRLPTSDLPAATIQLDLDWPTIAQSPAHNLDGDATVDNLAYVIYTSGSTGKPKGVLITHANVMRLFTATDDWYHFDENDVWTLFHSYAFDFSVWEIWGALLYGGRLVVVPYLTSRSPADFYRLLADAGVTVLNQTPSAFRQLIRAEEEVGQRDLALRLVIFGGEALELNSLRPWFVRHGDERPLLVNMYGITETTVHVTYRPIRLADLDTAPGSVIGRPIPDLELYLLDRHQQPVPVGVTGELYVGGAGVARGYLNRPELTGQRFIPHSFRDDPGARLYRSGDLGRWLPDGDVEYLGRIDHQVKIRGFRIELGEIEAALAAHPAIREVCVLAREDEPGQKRLAAYLVIAPDGDTPAIGDLRAYLQETLPEYMVPAAFMFLDAFPLTTNGKIDRRALPAPEATRTDLAAAYIAPRSDTEAALAGIWADVLGLERVGVADNFFDLGGDSILSIRLLAKAREVGLEIALPDLFRYQTIAALAPHVETVQLSDADTRPFRLIPDDVRQQLPADVVDAYPLSRLQAGMLYHSELEPDTAVYLNVNVKRVRAPFDQSQMVAALDTLAARHPILRTSFHLGTYSLPLQLVHKTVRIPLQVDDLRQMTPAVQEPALADWLAAAQKRPFDWQTAPLVRFHVHRLEDDVFQLTMSEHHVILDGWSVAALLSEFFQIYMANLGEPVTIPPAPAALYSDFVAAEQAAVAAADHRRFWTAQVAGAPLTQIARWPLTGTAANEMRTHTAVLPADVVAALQALAKETAVPVKNVFLAAHLYVLGLLSGQTDVVTGLVTNGRLEQTDGERTLGLFLNTVPLRQQLDGGTWVDLIHQTFTTEQAILPHRRFPLVEIQQLQQGQPLFEAIFNFVHFHVYDGLHHLTGLQMLADHFYGTGSDLFSLDVVMDTGMGAVELVFEYAADHFPPAQIEAVAGFYTQTLIDMAGQPDTDYTHYSPLSPPERALVLDIWNQTEAEYPDHACVHELIAAQAARTPAATAVIGNSQALTYRELVEKANQLAHHLRQLGVGPDTVVGISLGRTPDMIVGLLGILKAGGAYLPLDPDYPRERLAFMIADAQTPVLLTTSAVAAQLPATTAAIVHMDTDWPAIARQPITSPENGATPDNLAYVIYTSGSTGRPKGVEIPHRALTNHNWYIKDRFRLQPSDRMLQFSTINFDVAVEEIFPTLISGASLVLNETNALTAVDMVSLVDKQRVTHLDLPTAYWQLLASEMAQLGLAVPASLRFVALGGEAVAPAAVAAWQKLDGNGRVTLLNGYGPTETTVIATDYEIQPEDGAAHRIPIGRPIANYRLYVLDGAQRPAPVGVPGELYIGGAGVGCGYRYRPQRTAQSFLPDPFANDGHARMYRSGDLARWLPNGNLEFLGRTDHQVKLRGYRIELGEIEAALQTFTTVKEAVVLVREDEPGNKRLVAYMLTDAEDELDTAVLQRHLRARLPDYMIPALFVPLATWPLTPNGKIDRSALPAPADNLVRSRADAYVAPQTDLERVLVNIWEEVLQVNPLGTHDDFFELGGHSLLAIRLIARIRETLRLELPLRTLFDAPTVATLATAILTQSGDNRRIEKIARLVWQVSQMTPEEVAVMLRQKQAARSGATHE